MNLKKKKKFLFVGNCIQTLQSRHQEHTLQLSCHTGHSGEYGQEMYHSSWFFQVELNTVKKKKNLTNFELKRIKRSYPVPNLTNIFRENNYHKTQVKCQEVQTARATPRFCLPRLGCTLAQILTYEASKWCIWNVTSMKGSYFHYKTSPVQSMIIAQLM